VTNRVTITPYTARLQRTLADSLNGSALGCLHVGDVRNRLRDEDANC